MKSTVLTSTALVGLLCVVSIVPSFGATVFNSATLEDYLIPTTGFYAFTVAGAEGGNDDYLNIGGGGALISGRIFFLKGTDLSILTGAPGGVATGNSAGGGGGMSFISEGTTPLIVAGGGGGAFWFGGFHGGDAQIGTAIGGTSGQGGTGYQSGAGWYSNGSPAPPVSDPDDYTEFGSGGLSWPSFQGGTPNQLLPEYFTSEGGAGGFGGGGGGGYSCGGAGGGYSGGVLEVNTGFCFATGGGSFISPLAGDIVAIAGGNLCGSVCAPLSGYGFVDLSAVPEPSEWALMIAGFGLLGLMLRRERKRLSRRVNADFHGLG